MEIWNESVQFHFWENRIKSSLQCSQKGSTTYALDIPRAKTMMNLCRYFIILYFLIYLIYFIEEKQNAAGILLLEPKGQGEGGAWVSFIVKTPRREPKNTFSKSAYAEKKINMIKTVKIQGESLKILFESQPTLTLLSFAQLAKRKV